MDAFGIIILIAAFLLSGFMLGYITASEKKEKELIEDFQCHVLEANLSDEQKVALLQHFMEDCE